MPKTKEQKKKKEGKPFGARESEVKRQGAHGGEEKFSGARESEVKRQGASGCEEKFSGAADTEWIEGRNAVLEALKSSTTVECVYVEQGLEKGPIGEIIERAKEKNVKLRFVTAETLNRLSETKKPQGVMAKITPFLYSSVEEILSFAKEKNEAPFLLLLDGILDPHNLGAILRSAHLLGCHGVVLPKDRAASITATVYKTSAGALHYLKVARVGNLCRTMEELKKEGLWLYGAEMNGTVLTETDFTGPVGILIGSEGNGLSRLVREHCDGLIRIPMVGAIDSLNASVSAGILTYEVMRQRLLKQKKD